MTCPLNNEFEARPYPCQFITHGEHCSWYGQPKKDWKASVEVRKLAYKTYYNKKRRKKKDD